MRRPVLVELHRHSAVVSGTPRLWEELRRSGVRWHRHETSREAWRVHLLDVPDFVSYVEAAGYPVEVVGPDGRPIPVGGLLGSQGVA